MTDNEMLAQEVKTMGAKLALLSELFEAHMSALEGLINAIKKPGSGVVKPR